MLVSSLSDNLTKPAYRCQYELHRLPGLCKRWQWLTKMLIRHKSNAKGKTARTASGIIVQMNLDVAADNPSEGPNKIVDLTRVRAADGISNADAVDTNLVDGLVDGEEVDEVGTEGVFG